jgi:hypothetical protein
MSKTIRLGLSTAILLGMAVAANAQSVMKQCGEQWQAAKAAGTTSGATWPQFLAGTVRNLVCGAIVTPMEGAYGNQERHPGRFAGGA